MNTEEQIYMNFATGIHAPQMLNPHVFDVFWARSGSSENTPLSSCASYHHFTALQTALNTLEAANGSSSSIIWPEKRFTWYLSPLYFFDLHLRQDMRLQFPPGHKQDDTNYFNDVFVRQDL